MDVLVLGLNDVGISIAKLLQELEQDMDVTGYDPDSSTAADVKKSGELNRVAMGMKRPARKADMVFLCLPAGRVVPTLQDVGSELKEGAVVVDTSSLKAAIMKEAMDALPEGRYYIGAAPALNPGSLFLEPGDEGLSRREFLKDGVVALVVPPQVPEEQLKKVVGLMRSFGAEPFFVDAGEVDGMTAVVQQLPLLASAAYSNSVDGTPGWKEAQRLIGREFASLAQITYNHDAGDVAAELVLNKQAVLHRLDALIAELQKMRTDLAAEERSALEEALDNSRMLFADACAGRKFLDWDHRSETKPDLPQKNILRDLFGIRLGSRDD